jgi:hypothetical protein
MRPARPAAAIRGRSAAGLCSVLLEADGNGHWLVDGDPARHLDGCLDVDLEASAMTNALPVRRLGLPVAAGRPLPPPSSEPSAWPWNGWSRPMRKPPTKPGRQCYDYAAPAFDFEARLVTTNPACCSTTRGSLSGPADQPCRASPTPLTAQVLLPPGRPGEW